MALDEPAVTVAEATYRGDEKHERPVK